MKNPFISMVIVILLISASAESMARSISKSDIIYEGTFRVPHGLHNGTNFGNNSYLNAQYQPFAYNPNNNSIFMGSITGPATQPKRIGEFSVPEIIHPSTVDYDIEQLPQAVVIQAPQDISSGDFDKIRLNGNIPSDEAKAQLGGLYVYNNTLLGTVWGYYDANGAMSYRSHFSANLDWTTATGFSGLHAVGVSPTGSFANGGFVGGYMAEVPVKYRDQIGAPMLTGRTGGPIVSRSSYGPTLWSFDPADFDFDTPAPATMLIGYPDSHQTLGGYSDVPSTLYNRGAGVRAVLWPEQTDSILFIGTIGLGIKYHPNGTPVINSQPSCRGPGTSNAKKALSNAQLKKAEVGSYICGPTTLTYADIYTEGKSCCFDPTSSDDGEHTTEFVLGKGTSCYGLGTKELSETRTNAWLKQHSPTSYSCGGITMSGSEISAGDGCCYVGKLSTDKGGTSYPSVYQVWQYNVNDLLDVKSGSKKPWEVVPEVWNFDLPFVNPDRSKGLIGATIDQANERIFIAQSFGDGNYPLVHVFKISNSFKSPHWQP